MRLIWIVLGMILSAVGAASCRDGTQETRKLPQEAYIWQRSWNADVVQAVDSSTDLFRAYVVLCAQIDSGPDGRLHVVTVPVDWQALAHANATVGIGIRVGSIPQLGAGDSAALDAIKSSISESIRQANAAGINPIEVQIDYDAASSRLEGYAAWLPQVRSATGGLPLTITALPDWLHRGAFAQVLRQVDGYVLQVHGLARPETSTDDLSIISPQNALAWARAAGRYGKPFRLALPTYGYAVSFDKKGRFIELSAEDFVRFQGTVHEVTTDPVAMQTLLARLNRRPPPGLEGILWYRLPLRTDKRNWSLPTLRAVISGETLRSDVVVECRPKTDTPALVDIALANRGTLDGMLPPTFTLNWTPTSQPIASDFLPPYQRGESTAERLTVRLAPGATSLILRPGQFRLVGWMRFGNPIASLTGHLPPDLPQAPPSPSPPAQ